MEFRITLDRFIKLFGNIKYFVPTYRQCWVIVFYICIIGGIGIGAALIMAASITGVQLNSINPVITYLLPIIPAFIYILFKGNEAAKSNDIAKDKGLYDRITEPVPLNQYKLKGIKPCMAALLTVIATLCSMVALEPVSILIPMPETVKEIYRQMFENTLWTSVSVVIAAPLVEEFLLRGVMLRGMLKHTYPLKAIIYSALFFALIHMNLYQAAGAFLLGLFMGWIYYITGSLWLTILIHFTNNGCSTLFTILLPESYIDTSLMELVIQHSNTIYYTVLYIVAVLIFTAIAYYFHKNAYYGKE